MKIVVLDGYTLNPGDNPREPENPLLSAKNCLLTPHMAWSTFEARQRLMQGTAENIRAFIAGKPINVVNRAYLV